MPIKLVVDETDDAVKVWKFWRKDPDTQTPVRFLVRPIPAEMDKRMRRKYAGGLKQRQMNNEPMTKVIERGEEMTYSRASHALLDSENFVICLAGPKAAEVYSEALGEPLKPGAEVCLDHRWTDAVKAAVLSHLPKLAVWLGNSADEIAALDAEEEETVTGN